MFDENAHSQEWFATRLNWLCANEAETYSNEAMPLGDLPTLDVDQVVRHNRSSVLCDEVSDSEAMSNIVQHLKIIAHVDRLMILLELLKGPRSVGDLVELSKLRQPTVSQMLAKLRGGGLVKFHRRGKTVIYYISEAKTRSLLSFIKFTYFHDDALFGMLDQPAFEARKKSG